MAKSKMKKKTTNQIVIYNRKSKDWATLQKPGVNPSVPKGLEVSAPLVTPIMFH